MQKRFINVNSQQLRKLRLQRGWTQEDLARRAGYTDRLIRKAETGGSLEFETVMNLAEALSEAGEMVQVHHLTNDLLSMAKRFMECYDSLGREMFAEVEHILADDFVMHVAGDKSSAPFAGDWVGKEGFQQFLDCFFETFTRTPNTLEINYTVGDESVCARYQECHCYLRGERIPGVWVNLHILFRNGMIYRIDDEYDTGATKRFGIQF